MLMMLHILFDTGIDPQTGSSDYLLLKNKKNRITIQEDGPETAVLV